MSIDFPKIKSDWLGFGVGMDMPWDGKNGFVVSENGSVDVAEGMKKFFKLHDSDFNYSFLSYQPRGRGRLDAKRYREAFARFRSFAPTTGAFALHHTILNMGSTQSYPWQLVADFTNELIEEFAFDWVNEDLGIWSIDGKSLPYPLAPLLDHTGLRSCIENIARYLGALKAPLLVEFPGFSEGSNVVHGKMHAYEYFAEIAARTGCAVTLDTGHLISYQWFRGKRGDELFDELDLLPLEHCFEIHLSGCQIVKERFFDFHHGVIMDEQIELLKILLDRCPNAKAVTYEDPRFVNSGELIKKSLPNFQRLRETIQNASKMKRGVATWH